MNQSVLQAKKERQKMLLARLRENDWQELRNKVWAYVRNQHGYKPHLKIDCIAIGGYEAIADEAILRTLAYKRLVKWSFDNDSDSIEVIKQDVLRSLFGTAKSIVSHLRDQSHPTESDDSPEYEEISSALDPSPTQISTPEWHNRSDSSARIRLEVSLDQIPALGGTPEDNARYRELGDYMTKVARGTVRKTIVQVLFENPKTPPKEIADDLHTNVKDVQNTKKWLRRQLSKLYGT